MAMTRGSVTINPTTGSASGTGVAKEIFDVYDATIDYQGLTGTNLAQARKQIADLCNSVAYVIDHIKTNAVVDTDIQVGSLANGVTAGGATANVTGTTLGTVS